MAEPEGTRAEGRGEAAPRSASNPVQGQAAGNYPGNGNFSIALKGDDTSLCGTITFGPPSELVPATDPTASYPPNDDFSKWLPLIDGLKYLLAEPTVSGKRVQFGISTAQPMRSWRQLQVPYFDAQNLQRWGCTRNLDTRYTYGSKQCHQTDPCTGAALLISCEQYEICQNLQEPCVCNAGGCDGNSQVQSRSGKGAPNAITDVWIHDAGP